MLPILMQGFDDLATGARQQTRARTVTEADVVTWCATTGDWFPLHSDAQYAKGTTFGQRIAPGLMVLSFATGLGVPAESRTVLANYGLDHVRFTAPVFIGDTIRIDAEVVAKDTRDEETGLVTLRWDVINQESRPVCVSRLLVLLARRQPDGMGPAEVAARRT